MSYISLYCNYHTPRRQWFRSFPSGGIGVMIDVVWPSIRIKPLFPSEIYSIVGGQLQKLSEFIVAIVFSTQLVMEPVDSLLAGGFLCRKHLYYCSLIQVKDYNYLTRLRRWWLLWFGLQNVINNNMSNVPNQSERASLLIRKSQKASMEALNFS